MHDWTGEDRGYALATAMASLLIAVLVAGGFGLGPLDPAFLSRSRAPEVRVAPFAATTIGATEADAGPAGQVLGSSAVAPEAPGPAPAPAITDTSAPKSSITTPDGSVVAVTSSGAVTGIASDERSGVDRVLVTFRPVTGDPLRVRAELACTGPARRACSWSASPPQLAGSYTVSSRAIDAAGNTEPDPRPTRSITVVNASTQPQEDQRGLMAETVDVLGSVVRTVGGLLGL